jgi:hypothetical protein
MKRFLSLGAVLVLFAICSGCGDVFRPIIIPNPLQFPNPQAAHTALTISDNGTAVSGSAMVIDVSGDTNESQKSTGLRPVHAVQQTGTVMLVVNQSDSAFPQDSVTKLTFSGVAIGNTTTITLPASYDSSGNVVTAMPNFVATTESNQAYVSMPFYQPQNSKNPGLVVPSLAVISTVQNSIVATIPVGTTPNANPVAIAETPNQQKLYVANNGDNSVNAFNVIDRSARTITNAAFSSPLWISARNDSQRVYVLGNGVVSTIDTTTSSGPDNVIGSIALPQATRMWYDTILNRLYIPGSSQVTILDVSQSTPTVMGGGSIAIPTVPPTSRAAGDPCATTSVGTLSVAAVTSLPDGSRAYVGAYYIDSSDNVCPQVTVINASTNTIKTSIAVPGFPDATNPASAYYVPACAATRDTGPLGRGFRFNMAAGGDSTRAYLSSCDGGNVNIIDTSTDTYALNVPAPNSARPPIPPSTQNPPQNPVFMLAGP